MNPFTVRKDLTKIQPVSKSTDLKIIYSGKPLKETNMKIGKALELDATIVGKTDAEFTDIYRYVKFPKKAKIIIIYIYFRNVRSPCLDPRIRPQQNALAKTSQGRAIPRWNRLGKRN